jgi:hypothetical protein
LPLIAAAFENALQPSNVVGPSLFAASVVRTTRPVSAERFATGPKDAVPMS